MGRTPRLFRPGGSRKRQGIALLMRGWETDTGTEIERCDLKCGGEALFRFRRPFLTPPLRMRGKRWVGIAFDEGTEEALVFRLFDEAVSAGAGHRTTVILDSRPGATLILEPKLPGGAGRLPGDSRCQFC